MSFTPQELRILSLADAAEGADRVGQGRGGGRPRTRPDTPRNVRIRQRALAKYYRRKLSPTPPNQPGK